MYSCSYDILWDEGIRFFEDRVSNDSSENLLILYSNNSNLNSNNGIYLPGKARSVAIPIRRIVLDALTMRCSKILIAHNHPSGDPRPSKGDVEQTRALVRALAPLNIQLADHRIIGGGNSYSFRAEGLI